jgi:hypothetical protein
LISGSSSALSQMVPVSVDDDELAELHTEVDLDEDEVSIVEPATQQHEGIMTMYFCFLFT